MAIADYSMPVAQLLAIGDPRKDKEWRNYVKLGFTPAHIPDLIRMALDEDLHRADSESKEVWSPIHAWRALGQLRAQDAIQPLLALFQRIDDDEDDWVSEELPCVFGMIGPVAIPALTDYLADTTHGLWARIAASGALEKIAAQYPTVRTDCVMVITHQIEQLAKNDPILNGSMVADLLDLKAIESASTLERAFAVKCVDISIAGDWQDVQIEFGMIKERTTPRERTDLDVLMDGLGKMVATAVSRQVNPFGHKSALTDDVIYRMLSSGELKPPIKPQTPKMKKKKL